MIHRGDVLVADLRPMVGHEQGGRRPVLVLSTDAYNSWPIGMLFVAPITSVERDLPHHVAIGTDAGLRSQSFVMPEYARAISAERTSRPALGSAAPAVVDAVQRWLHYFTSESP